MWKYLSYSVYLNQTFFGGKITLFRRFFSKKICPSFTSGTQKSLRLWKQESLKILLKENLEWENCLEAHPVITNTKLCLQNNQGDLQKITGNLDYGSKNRGNQKRKRTCIQVCLQTVCRLNIIFIKACTCGRSRLAICWQKDKSPSGLRMYFYSKSTHWGIEKNGAVNTWIFTYGGV